MLSNGPLPLHNAPDVFLVGPYWSRVCVSVCVGVDPHPLLLPGDLHTCYSSKSLPHRQSSHVAPMLRWLFGRDFV